MNAFVLHALPGVLLGLLFKSVGLLLVAGTACFLLRRASAATRHLVWSSALGGLLLLPFLSLSLPHWNLAVRRATTQVSTRPLPPVSGPSPAVGKPSSSPPRDGEGEPIAIGEQGSQGSSAANGVADGKPLSPSFTPRDRRPFPLRGGGRSLATGGKAGRILPLLVELVWLLGVIVLLARLAVGLRRVELIRRRAVPLDAAILVLAETLRDQLGLRRPVTFLRAAPGSGVAVPLTWGGRRPTVLLPEQSGAWPADTCRAALLHELAHVSRWDWTTQTLSRVVCALYWVNPLVWVAARLARAESERACDDCVLGAGLSPADYAQNLVDVVRSMPPGPPLRTAAIAMAQPSEVESRLRALLAKGRNRGPLTRKLALGTLAVFLLIALPLAALRLTAQAQITLTAADAIQPAPGGGTIRLVGIGEFPDANKTWWGKDGVRLTTPPAWSMDHGMTMSKPPQGQAYRQVVLEATGTAPGDDFTVQAPPSPGGGMSWGGEHIGSPIPIGWVGAFPLAEKTCTVRVGIAHTPWQMLASDGGFPAGGSSGSDTAEGVGSITYSFSTLSEIKGKVAITVADTATGLPTRVVAIDTQGRTVPGDTTGGDSSIGSFHQRTVTFPGLALKDIKDIQLQWRPYDWIEFKNVPLQPVASSATNQTGEGNRQGEGEKQGEGTSPLRTVAPTSRIVPVISVSTYPPTAESWWDTQGARLPGPPKFWTKKQTQEFAWLKGRQGRVLAVEIAKTQPDDHFMVDWPQPRLGNLPAAFDTGMVYHTLSGHPEGDRSLTEQLFPATQKTCRIRLGEASGPWQTLAIHPGPLPARGTASLSGSAAGVGKYTAQFSPPFVSGWETEFRVSCTVAAKPAQLCEIRVVAINARGETVLPAFYPVSLDSNSGLGAESTTRGLSMKGQDVIFPTTALKGIKEFQIQWRPFDWVAYKDVPLQPVAAAPQKETAMKNPLVAPAIALFGFSAAAAPAQIPPVTLRSASASATVVQKAEEAQKAARADALAHQIAVLELKLVLNDSHYAANHPIIEETRATLAALRLELSTLCPADSSVLIASAAEQVMEPKIDELTAKEMVDRRTYAANHPLIVTTLAQIESIRRRLNELRQAAMQGTGQTSVVPALRPAAQKTTAAAPLTAAQAKTEIQQACSHMDAVLDSKDITAVLALLTPDFTRQSPEGAWEDQVAFAADMQRLFARPGPLNTQTRVLKATIEDRKVTAIVTQSFARRADSDTPQAFTLSETWRRIGGVWRLSHMGEYNEITPASAPPAAAKTSRTATPPTDPGVVAAQDKFRRVTVGFNNGINTNEDVDKASLALAEARLRVAVAQKSSADIANNLGMIVLQRQKLLTLTQEKYKAGIAPYSDVMQSKADLAEAQARLSAVSYTPSPASTAAAKTSRTATPPAARRLVSPATRQNQYVQVTGIVKAPGIYAFRPGMRLRDLIALGGGPTQPLDTIQATILIGGHPTPIDLAKLMKGDASQNLALASDDILILAPAK